MISAEYCRLLAQYNRWMNERLYAVAGELTDAERKRDRGAFFGSIHRTQNHILWGDRIWLGRFTGKPYTIPAYGADTFDDFEALLHERRNTDAAISRWSGEVSDAWLASTIEYRAASDGRRRQLPAWIAAVHLFQHATHHRGQLTTLLKQAGKEPGVTDVPYMPGIVRLLD